MCLDITDHRDLLISFWSLTDGKEGMNGGINCPYMDFGTLKNCVVLTL